MSLTTILVLGANGMLGRYMASYFEGVREFIVIRFTRRELDASNINYQKLYDILSNYNDAIVINCIGKIPQRGDNNDRLYIKINSIFPHMLSACCQKTNNKLIHITTDCVYTGKKGNYIETDEHDETNLYGLSKSLGEPDNCCIIRTSIVGEEIENKKSLLEWVKSNKDKTISGFKNHFWNGVTCLELAKIIHTMLNKNILWIGVRHLFSPEIVSKYELAKIISDVYDLHININPIETEYFNKSLNSIYVGSFIIPPLNEQIFELKNFSQWLV